MLDRYILYLVIDKVLSSLPPHRVTISGAQWTAMESFVAPNYYNLAISLHFCNAQKAIAKQTMADEARAMLDALMGADRNAPVEGASGISGTSGGGGPTRRQKRSCYEYVIFV